MDFFAVNGTRPIRLSEETRTFAYESLNHKYGKDTLKTPYINLDSICGFDKLSDIEKYDIAIKEIAEKAPLRIVEGEKLSGAATLGDAIRHQVPARYNGKNVFYSISHLTIDFEGVVKYGINALREKAFLSYEKYKNTEKALFAKSCLNCLDAFDIWHKRYLEALKNSPLKDNYENLKKVPHLPATSFFEAVQSIWFVFSFVRLCGNWPGIGRIDAILGQYLKNDLEKGIITIEEAREILAHFFIKGCEWITGEKTVSGDAQHYQNIVLAGVDEFGREVTNEVTYLVLDIIEETGISDFPTTVRVNENTSQELIYRVAEVMRFGGGVLAIYGENTVLNGLIRNGYSIKEARKFANDGCWEVQVPGKTYFIYLTLDALKIFQQNTLLKFEKEYQSFNELYNQFIADIEKETYAIADYINKSFVDTTLPKEKWVRKAQRPCTVISLFEQGCIEKGLSYLEGGPEYNMVSPHIGGLPDAVNSLYAIKKLVFDDKIISFKELNTALKNNWEGYEDIRLAALNKYEYFGNDNDEVDLLAVDVVEKFSGFCENCQSKINIVAGISTFGRQIEWADLRLATPTGKKANSVLSGNFSPAPGTDKKGATSIIKSYCKADFTKTVSGAALDIKLMPSDVSGENGINVLSSIIRTFVKQGGFFMQLDIADIDILKKAQQNPEEYKNLSVRVSGWNARFVTLSKDWQDMIIEQMK